jgi:hypothetical protein
MPKWHGQHIHDPLRRPLTITKAAICAARLELLHYEAIATWAT